MAYDVASGQLILFTGGQGSFGGFSNNTYAWSGSSWTELAPAQVPSPRGYAAMAYDPALGKLILFGGQNSSSILGDMWAWDGSNWSQLNPVNPPPARMAASMTYDDATGKLVLFGGTNNLNFDNGALGDTWTWDGTTWTASPYSPSNVIATAGQGTATVAWTPPSDNGGVPITSYTVTASPGGASVTVNAPTTTAQFSGLAADCQTTYTFTVTANSVAGSSPPSAPSNTVMPSGHPSNPPKATVILIGGVNSHVPDQNVYDPLSLSYCGLRGNSQIPSDLQATVGYFDLQSSLVPNPSPNLTDALAATGAVILPFSYNVASFAAHPGCHSLLTVNPYWMDVPGIGPTDLSAQILNAEVQSIHCLWPSTKIVIIGHSQGGLVGETYWQNYLPSNPAPVTNVFSLDSPINGVAKPALATALQPFGYTSIYTDILAAMPFKVSPAMLNSYFQRWQNRAAIDQAILNANGAGVFVPIGTDGDVAYDAFDLYGQSITGQSYYPGLDSQLLYNPFPGLGQYGTLVGTDYETPTYPPDPLAAHNAGQDIVSHGYVMEEPGVIAKLKAAVASAVGPMAPAGRSGPLHQPKVLNAAPASAVAGNPPPMGTLSPTVAAPGATMTITGSNFGATAGKVQFVSTNSSDAVGTVQTWSATSVKVTIPSNAKTGPVYLTTLGGSRNPMGGLTVLGATNTVTSLTVKQPAAPIDGQPAAFTITAKDRNNRAVANVPVFVSDYYGSESGLTNTSGVVTLSFRAFAGEPLVTYSGRTSTTFQTTWQAPPTQTLTLSASATSLSATQTATLTAKVTNSTGGAVPNQVVKFQLTGSSTASLSASQATTNAAGVAAVTATNSSSGSAGVSAQTDYDFQTQGLSITWSPTITSISPNSGPTSGGTQVTVTGTGFASGAVAYFGNVPAASVVVANTTTLTATSPANTGTVDVTLSVAGAASATTTADRFAYIPPPTVTGVSPSAGPSAGATQVSITGTNFVSGAEVTFGSAAASNVVVNSSTSISATSPANFAGTVDVVVTVPVGGSSATSAADQFTYDDPPTVSSVSPNAGPTTGGTTVTITGTNFVAGSTVSFGGVAATGITVASSTSLTAISPSSIGSSVVDVVVQTPGGTSSVSASDQFAYGTPSVSSVSPNSGPAAGGTQVTINGSGFVAGVSVAFGSLQGSSVTVVSTTSLTVISPSASPGTVDITVTSPAGMSAQTSNDRFTFQ